MARYRPPDFLPREVLERPDFISACERRDLGDILAIAVKWGGAGFSLSHVARSCAMGITQVHDYMDHKREPLKIEIFERVADGLHIPGKMLGLSLRAWESDGGAEDEEDDEDDSVIAVTPLQSARQGSPNLVLRRIREQERHETRDEFADAMAKVARELGEEIYPTGKYVERLENGKIRYPRPPYRRVLMELCGRSLDELGFTVNPGPSPFPSDDRLAMEDAGEGAARGSVNKPLRDAVMASGLEVAQIARRVGVHPKTALRWITTGRIPHPKQRWKVAEILGREESELWPSAVKESETKNPAGQSGIGAPSPAEIDSQFGIYYDPAGVSDRMSELANWAEVTNISDGVLSYLDSATFQLAHDCLTVSPFQAGERADALVKRISTILRSGRQRLGQTRDLYVIAGKLCAILSWISSDLGELALADAHARNGWTLADQADHDGLRALLLSARSKVDFWRRRYGDAAKHARRGYEYNPPGTLRVLLACQEADALRAIGRIADAMEALARSERTQDAIHTQDDASESDELGGIFGCGIARQANYSIATYLRPDSTDRALLHVDRAERAWRDGEEWAYGTWAQVQIGAAIAHLMNGEIDGAALILQRIIDSPAEKRLATLTTRLHRDVTPLLASSVIGHSKLAITLREGISDYGSSPLRQLPPSGVEL